ncbi:hypothetical protein CBI38_30075 [Rhodococcus oxybenzonivorans]|uniref:Uncharacterized protein n=1 Tax=Rhodococcus oxybenzonivorans TaxID=1990687 RepID=A0A2S2C2X5_9NOCA|nr:hypothetical protein CBI38_30075 [Rhodococcus oxybenzonivorans]
MALLTIGKQFPAYNLTALSAAEISNSLCHNVEEALLVLDALQSDQLCACNWTKGDPTISPGALLSGSI